MSKLQYLTVILFISTAYLAMDKYFNHYKLHLQWLQNNSTSDAISLESRVSLFQLKKLLSESEFTVKQAAYKLVKQDAEFFDISLKNCSVDTFGNLNKGIIVKVNCPVAN
jgi:hypothetical protein